MINILLTFVIVHHVHTYRQQIDHLEMEEARNLSLPRKYRILMDYHLQLRESTRVYEDNENHIDRVHINPNIKYLSFQQISVSQFFT